MYDQFCLDKSDSKCQFISAWGRGKLAGVWTAEMQREKHQIQLWQQFLTLIFPGLVCWASCSWETAVFIAIKLHSFPPYSRQVWPQPPTNGHRERVFSLCFLSWPGGLILWPTSLYPISQGMDHDASHAVMLYLCFKQHLNFLESGFYKYQNHRHYSSGSNKEGDHNVFIPKMINNDKWPVFI